MADLTVFGCGCQFTGWKNIARCNNHTVETRTEIGFELASGIIKEKSDGNTNKQSD